MVVGYVESPLYPDANTLWGALTAAASAYDNGLTYCLFPELNQSLIGSCNGYNSNSYAMGLIKSRAWRSSNSIVYNARDDQSCTSNN